jgi:hypothetical protein
VIRSQLRTFIVAVAVANIGLSSSALAYSQRQLHTEYTGTVLYDPLDDCTGGGVSAASFGPGDLPSYIKSPYNAIFTAAAKKYNTDPAVLVAIFYDENFGYQNAVASFKAHAYRNPPPPYGTGPPWPVSSANARGPFQFIPSTYAHYEIVANGHPPADPNDLTDESYSAASYLHDIGASSPVSVAKVQKAAASYYGAPGQYSDAAGEIFRLIKQDEGAGATTGDGTGTIGITTCSGANASSVDCYKNPLRDQKPLAPARIDEGVDYLAAGPIYALGQGHVDYVGLGVGWPGGVFLSYILDCGPASGKRVYVAEHLVNVGVHVGQKVDSNTRLADEVNSFPYDEIGWGLQPSDFGGQSVDLAAAYKVYVPDGTATAYGQNFNDLMVKLGAPQGLYDFANQKGGKNLTGTLPAGWPQWK